ncbi:hypothetical protein J437_LFUL007019 [Ladona fulva]|uniref:Uncharacterized protein n=1 Tax=Ladona fulva TaxID=123851 RepID=A0A8K0K4P3_LADFU|nr:hypothetical protein J437_LFUL007019 [Ladona fulva]
MSEINAYKVYGIDKNGEWKRVFKKLCRGNPQIKQCLDEFLDADICLKEEEKAEISNVIDMVFSLICHKDGEGIALFIAGGGLECVQSKQQELLDCYYSNSKESLSNEMKTALSSTNPNEIWCMQLTLKEGCVMKSVEACQKPTLTNLARSIVYGFKKVLRCSQYFEYSILTKCGSGNIVSPLTQTVISAFIALVVLVCL